VNKPNNIRKKALDYVKKRQWDKALEEFSRLVEIELHNPNLFNEIGDIHLKLGNKREAFRRYHEAIDAYTKVGLLNNAVAVCKKILRLNPNDNYVYGKMATLRQRQGFAREAEGYALDYLDKVLKSPPSPDDEHRALVVEVADLNGTAPEVLERAAEYLMRSEFMTDAGNLFVKLEQLYHAAGRAAERQAVQQKMKSIGYKPPPVSEPAREPSGMEGIGAHRHQAAPGPAAREGPFRGSTPPHIRRGHQGDVAADFGVIEMGAPDGDAPAQPEESVPPPKVHARPNPAYERERGDLEPEAPAGAAERPSVVRSASASPAPPRASAVAEPPVEPQEYVIPDQDAGEESAVGNLEGPENAGEPVDPTDVFTDAAREVKADVDEGDYRSHYDLGMAYLEMNLLTEAIREFQFAASSPTYQVRSLEMIGRCFISQNQPKLAIKQLSKGLKMVEGDERAALGIKYSLGLAYEMVGDTEKARTLFEDVYVVDVTFRDIEEKMKSYQT
jgi:tetratricopeptide (TPR) repeat protein